MEDESNATIRAYARILVGNGASVPDGKWIWFCARCGVGEPGEAPLGQAMERLVLGGHARCADKPDP